MCNSELAKQVSFYRPPRVGPQPGFCLCLNVKFDGKLAMKKPEKNCKFLRTFEICEFRDGGKGKM